ncbi:MAG: pyruvate ferredoxin oxidoreductase [Prevotella sp.]|jgi:hypothetical protein|nr:pyruvate ferredoxin oxidoreductase [Prevotella sp.]
MDYTYISQLVERYFNGQTTDIEEQMLQLFFQQPLPADLPGETARYAPLFRLAQADREQMHLPDGFAETVEAKLNIPPTVKAVTVSLADRLKPLFRAAAAVAVVLTMGNAMQFTMTQAQPGSDEINYAEYKDTYTDPGAAYQQTWQALRLVTEGLAMLQQDTTAAQTGQTMPQ